jgi:hypothetical protein
VTSVLDALSMTKHEGNPRFSFHAPFLFLPHLSAQRVFLEKLHDNRSSIKVRSLRIPNIDSARPVMSKIKISILLNQPLIISRPESVYQCIIGSCQVGRNISGAQTVSQSPVFRPVFDRRDTSSFARHISAIANGPIFVAVKFKYGNLRSSRLASDRYRFWIARSCHVFDVKGTGYGSECRNPLRECFVASQNIGKSTAIGLSCCPYTIGIDGIKIF